MSQAIAIWIVTLAVAIAALVWLLRPLGKNRIATSVADQPSKPAEPPQIVDADKAFGYNRWGLFSAIWFWAMLAAPFGYLCRTGYWSPERWMCRSHVFDFALIVPYAFSAVLMAYWIRRAYVEGKRKEFRSMLRTLVVHSFWGVMYVWVVFG